MAVKYVFVTGGVVSGLGKGISSFPWKTSESTWISGNNAEV